MTLEDIVKQLQACGYECEAGSLVNHEAFRELFLLAVAYPDFALSDIDRLLLQHANVTPETHVLAGE